MRTWLSKSIYEPLPYFYLGAGIALLAAADYLDYWHWQGICLALGVSSLIAGTVVLWRRQEYRRRHR